MNSMTGYGFSEGIYFGRKMRCEIKSVNNRFLEIDIKIPKEISEFEFKIRREIKRSVKRGKVSVVVEFDKLLYRVPFSLFRRKKKENSFEDFYKTFKIAMQEFETSRSEEGEAIENDIRERIRVFETLLDEIKEKHKTFPEKVKEKLKERVNEIAGEIFELTGDRPIVDDKTIENMGVVHIVRKSDIQEEIVRLDNHIEKFKKVMEEGGDGKTLVFILQEMLRETNTIAAKSQDIEILNAAIDMKIEAERMREQIANVE